MLRLNEFELLTPSSIDEAVAVLEERERAIVVAGGTDLVPKMKRGQIEPAVVVSLADIPELRGVDDSDGLRIGALTTLRSLERDPRVSPFTAVAQAVGLVATPIIRTRATLGGNLLQDTRCRYYDRSHFWRGAVDHCLKKDGDVCRVAAGGSRCYATFCSDVAPALIVHDATVELVGREPQTIPLEALYLDDGIAYVDTRKRLLARVSIPAGKYRSAYRKLRMRESFDFPEAGVAVAVRDDSDSVAVNVALVGIGSRVVVHKTTCSPSDLDAVADAVMRDVRPVDTMYFPPGYRKKMAGKMLRQCIDELL
jgi:4-hydroxybenzoyl-CoA reductase subunit beta